MVVVAACGETVEEGDKLAVLRPQQVQGNVHCTHISVHPREGVNGTPVKAVVRTTIHLSMLKDRPRGMRQQAA